MAAPLARLLHEGKARWAAVADGVAQILPPGFRYGDPPPGPTGEDVPLAGATLLPPLEPGARVFCVGRNYRDHAEELGDQAPAAPSLFQREPESLVGADTPLDHPGISNCYDFEGEIALVLGSGGWRLSPAAAAAAIGGVTLLMDGSVRDFQRHSLLAGKNFRRSGAVGPWIVAAEGVDLARLSLETCLNGQTVQRGALSDLIHGPAALVAYLSSILELRTGDIIATGTPAGVGMARTPPLWLHDGDRIEVRCDAIGTLANRVQNSFRK